MGLIYEYIGRGYDLTGVTLGMGGLELIRRFLRQADNNLFADKHETQCGELDARFIRKLIGWDVDTTAKDPQQVYNFPTESSMKINSIETALLALALLCSSASATATGTPIINYPSGFTGATCQDCAPPPANKPIWISTGVRVVGSQLEVLTNASHSGNNFWYSIPVNIQAFTTTFTFQYNCSASPTSCAYGLGFMIIANNASNPYYTVCPGEPPGSTCGYNYTGFAGPYFSWAQNCNAVGNDNCLAIDEAIVKFDLYDLVGPGRNLTNYCQASTTIGGTYPQPFSGSTANPNCGGFDLNMAPSGINMQSGDIFKVTLTYDGSNLFESITDTNTNATFTHTYTGINLPSIVSSNTAFVGFGGATSSTTNTMAAYVNSWTYMVESPGSQ